MTDDVFNNTLNYPLEIILSNGDIYHAHKDLNNLSNKGIRIILLRTIANITRLNISNNNITFFPPINSLVYLDCSNCKLQAIPVLKNIETLICANNNIREISNMKHLKTLNCSYNPVITLRNMPKLTHLNYTQCPILTIYSKCSNISNIIKKRHRSSSIINGAFKWVENYKAPILLNWSLQTVEVSPATNFSRRVYKFLFKNGV